MGVCFGCQCLSAYLVERHWAGCLFWVSVFMSIFSFKKMVGCLCWLSVFMGIFSSKTMAWVSVLGVSVYGHI